MGVVSLSARRAWIEIAGQPAHGLPSIVALRKESVDRNKPGGDEVAFLSVALRKESVDRNPGGLNAKGALTSRSPQGERG